MRVARMRGPSAPALDAMTVSLLLGRVTMVSIEPPTEAQLRATLKQQACDVVVLSLSLAASSASYATAVLADSQGQVRKQRSAAGAIACAVWRAHCRAGERRGRRCDARRCTGLR